jgi:hypothetical protein
MNASDADRPESNENIPDPPVPSEPGDTNRIDSSKTSASEADASSSASNPGASGDTTRDQDPDVEGAEVETAARIPDPIRPAEGQSVDEPSVTFEWERVKHADNYQLQIAKDRDFTELIFDARVGSSSAFTYSGLPPQEGFTLYWRVRAHLREQETWTNFGTVGTFVLADWRPDQPALANAQDTSAPVADADVGDSSRAEPLLITFSIVVTVVAVGLAIIYMQDGGLFPDADETDVVETADADTVSLDLEQPVPNEDGETFRISIDDAMRQVVRERGGTWEKAGGEQADEADRLQERTPQGEAGQEETGRDGTAGADEQSGA